MPIGLYIHVPFCIKKCSYCDFVSYPHDTELAASYVYALEKEMQFHVKDMSEDRRVLKTIYIGGGTPTCLSGDQLTAVLDGCRRHFVINGDAEITAECNPGTVDTDKLHKMRKAGINRISIGVQAYQQQMLSILGRIHTWEEVETAVRNSRQAGFNNLSLDLIFGIPGQTMKDWQESLKRVVDLQPEHISAYNLKIETDTPMHRDFVSGQITPCDEDLEVEMFRYTIEFLISCGFEHYEISNFAKNGRKSRHNLIYWLNEEYLGLGPAAHSMLYNTRFSNMESVELYIQTLNRDESVVDSVTKLTNDEQLSETVFLGLRLIEGLDLKSFEQRYRQSFVSLFANQMKKLSALGLVEKNGDRLRLTDKGLPLANEVFVEFI